MSASISSVLAKSRIGRVAKAARGHVLDIGCGEAALLEVRPDLIPTYVGIDLDHNLIDLARKRFPQAEFICTDIDDGLKDVTGEFDCVVLTAVLEHVLNLGSLLSEIQSRLTPDGVVIGTTPTPFGNDYVHRFLALHGMTSRHAVNDHIAIFNKQRLKNLASASHLALIEHVRFQAGCNQFFVLRSEELGQIATD